MATPPYLQPFVIPLDERQREREGALDIYWPEDANSGLRPVIIFVHGGPIPTDMQPTPREWPVFIGYGSLAALNGVVGVTVDHRLHSPDEYPTAAEDIKAAVAQARELPGVDPGRVALWYFSGGGLLTADWLVQPPPWLRCIAASYPLMAPMPDHDVDTRFRPVEALAAGSDIPFFLTRVGRERPVISATVETFIEAAQTHNLNLEIVDVPEGQHSFDMLDHTDNSRAAVSQAMGLVTTALRA